MGFQIDGLARLENRHNAVDDEVDRPADVSIPIDEALSPEFLQACSRFRSLEEMLRESGYTIHSGEDFEAIPAEEWDAFIRTHTTYDSWQALLDDAGRRFLEAQS